MCRVIGITHFDWSKHRTIIERFCQLARTGVVMAEDPPGHLDGWGLAFYREGRLVVHKSGASILDERERLFTLLDGAPTAPALILHLRKSAWSGTSSTRHAHPFFLGNNVFFHNGVVYDYQQLLAQITPPGPPDDARDTEVFFHHVLSRPGEDLGAQFLASVATIRQQHHFSALNCLFSDGAKLYAYRDFAREPDYYSLFKAAAGDSCFISSEVLDAGMRWELMAKEEFLAIELGETV
ncbi:glutamine amidotransferase [Desulfuromonas sp. DDH964]|uniref:class II glutamine amidotransferase n=1 Tax=Desulfuromonas sp. DDH964 TaxID=1823759 RepID=UPI00078D9597|nr:class II glutamine amidotransferase [Desulfuromonas sp. DDH964]AMV71551.1 glutamine amidotransferase [Desulfuromonas sp. DDH964]